MDTTADPGTQRLAAIADRAIASAFDRDPVQATYLGDHSRDHLLPDPGSDATVRRVGELRVLLAELDAAAPSADPDVQVDAEVLRTVLAAEVLELDQIDEDRWNPMRHNPGDGVHSLLSRDFAPLPERLGAITARLRRIPDYLDAARGRLAGTSPVHVSTAVDQLAGTIGLVDEVLATAARDAPDLVGQLETVAEPARAALVAHRRWLVERCETVPRNARLGADLFGAKLRLTLDTAFDPTDLLADAESDLDRITTELTDMAGAIGQVATPGRDTVREVLDSLADDSPTRETILPLCRDALQETTAFVRDHDLVTIFDEPVSVVEMPEFDRGVAAAYCRPNGPLESVALPTEFAVSPAPASWDDARVQSFYREYNEHMLHNLTVHEAMPGHALQLMHANRHREQSAVRSVWWSGSFVEGWAVYAEELLARHGYRSEVSQRAARAVRMQQLKMQLRTTINAILDIRFHCEDLDEAAALELMTRGGFQEQGEADGKWRRVQLTSAQLCTYYVGYREMSGVARDLRSARPGWSERQVHDAMLAHGSPPARHLRTLLGLGATGA